MTQAQMNNANEKRYFRKVIKDLPGKDLLNLLIEQELRILLYPDEVMAAWKRQTCFDMIEWRLSDTDHRDEQVGQRVSSLRSRIRATLKKKDVQLSEKAIVAANQAILYERKMTEKRITTFNKGYDFAVSQSKLALKGQSSE